MPGFDLVGSDSDHVYKVRKLSIGRIKSPEKLRKIRCQTRKTGAQSTFFHPIMAGLCAQFCAQTPNQALSNHASSCF